LEGLKVPQKQTKRGRLWLTDGSRVRLRPTHRNHVCSWDFVMDRTDDGRAIKMLTLIDEYMKESLVIYPRRRIRSRDVIDIFADVMIERGLP
jgi:putative transposase